MNVSNSTSPFWLPPETSPAEAAKHAARHAQMLDAILASSSDHVYLLDRQGRCRYVGAAAASRLGLERESILGRKLEELGLPDEAVTLFDTHREQTFATGEVLEASVSIVFSDGVHDFEYKVIPFMDDSKENKEGEGKWQAEAVILRLTDVTEHNRSRQELRASEAKYRQLLDTANEGILALDAEDFMVYVNAHMAGMLGYTEQELYGRSLSLLLFEEDWAAAQKRKADHSQGHREQYECRLRRRDGSELWTLVCVSVLWEGEKYAGTFSMFMDITPQKRAAQERERHLREIEALNVRLKRAMAETHHRVRNNLQVLGALADYQILDDMPTVPVTEMKRILVQIRALAAVHDLLTEEAHSESALDMLSSRVLLERLLPLLTTVTGGRDIEFDAEEAALSSRQCGALALIVHELTVNALKHSRNRIRVTFTVQGKTGTLTVRDDGPGFPQGFDPTRSQHIGLSLASTVARWDLNGSLTCENPPEGGAQVTVTLPLGSER